MSEYKVYDSIVIGVGSMGSAALYQLAKKGHKVLGIEQYSIVHENGSHFGQSRVIRKAYFEHPDYVPLLDRAYELWNEIEEESRKQLFYKTGLASFGKSNHPAIIGTKKSAELYDVPIKEVERNRFSQFQIPEDFECLFEENAGFVTPEKAIKVYVNQAKLYGAEVKENTQVISWELQNDEVVITTTNGVYKAKKVICTAGGFSKKLFPQLNIHLKVTRQLIAWINPKNESVVKQGELPCWFLGREDEEGMFYGFPMLDPEVFSGEQGLKVGLHIPGDEINPDELHDFDSSKEEKRIKSFMDRYMPGVFDSFSSIKSCMYTYSPDGDFIIDYLPHHDDKVIIACGFSGHGFKFIPVVGEILSELAINGKTDKSIEFLGINRLFGK